MRARVRSGNDPSESFQSSKLSSVRDYSQGPKTTAKNVLRCQNLVKPIDPLREISPFVINSQHAIFISIWKFSPPLTTKVPRRTRQSARSPPQATGAKRLTQECCLQSEESEVSDWIKPRLIANYLQSSKTSFKCTTNCKLHLKVLLVVLKDTGRVLRK